MRTEEEDWGYESDGEEFSDGEKEDLMKLADELSGGNEGLGVAIKDEQEQDEQDEQDEIDSIGLAEANASGE